MPSIRKGETREQFKARIRDYMNTRNFSRTGRRPIRRIVSGGPQSSRLRLTAEDFRRRLEYREQVGLYPDRLRGIGDDGALVKAMEGSGVPMVNEGRGRSGPAGLAGAFNFGGWPRGPKMAPGAILAGGRR